MTTCETRTASAFSSRLRSTSWGHGDLGAEVHDLQLAVVLQALLPREPLDVQDRVDADRVGVGADAAADHDEASAQRGLHRRVHLLGRQQRVVASTTSTLLVSTRWFNHLVDTSKVEVVERDYPLLTPKEVNADGQGGLRRRLVVVGGCIGTDAHTVGIDAILNIKGFAGEKGLEYYRELKVVNLGAQVSVPAARRAQPGGEGRRRPGLPGRHPARRPPAQHPRDVRGVPRGLPGRRRPLLVVGGPALRRDHGRASSASTGSSPAAPRRARWPASSSTGSHRARHQEGLLMTAPRSAPASSHRRYVPYSHAHYAGNLVDGAYSLGLFGDVATEMCILTDGDEGLFASYSDVQFRAPGPGRRRPRDHLRDRRGSARRSRDLDLAVHVVARGAATAERPGAAAFLDRRRSWPRPPPAPSSSPA